VQDHSNLNHNHNQGFQKRSQVNAWNVTTRDADQFRRRVGEVFVQKSECSWKGASIIVEKSKYHHGRPRLPEQLSVVGLPIGDELIGDELIGDELIVVRLNPKDGVLSKIKQR
jgi:hypothetical protein